MTTLAASPALGMDAAPLPFPRGSPTIAIAIDEWIADLRARKRKPNGVDACRQLVERFVRDGGINHIDQVTFTSATAWLTACSATWKGSTYNRNLVLVRSWTRYLAKRGYLPADPLENVERAYGDPAEGSRAASVDEARAIIREAWARQLVDKRARKGNRALYWLLLFSHGCRASEPQQLRWKHVFLNDATPFILWSVEIQKNRRRMEVPLTRELVELLRRHRAEVPHEPEQPIFTEAATRHVFRKDRDAVGIAACDPRGRRFSPHSARKYFETTLCNLGVQARMVDRLMRHHSGIAARYFDPTIEEMGKAVAILPLLWPERIVDNQWTTLSDVEFGRGNLTNGPDLAEHGQRHIGSQAENRSLEAPAAAQPRRCDDLRAAPAGPSSDSSTADQAGELGQVGRATPAVTEMPISGLGRTGKVDPTLVADLLESIARLLRQEAQDGATRRRNDDGSGHAPDERGTDGRCRRA